MRKRLKADRRTAVAALDPRMSALLLLRPPAALTALVPTGATIGLYAAGADEAPTQGYAKWFHEAGHRLALPWFAARDAAMTFREWTSPYADDCLKAGPWSVAQPAEDAPEAVPDVVFVPLVGFSPDGGRLGQGGGHYDRWLAAHPAAVAIGLAWDCQMVEQLPLEPHDRALTAVVTPTRLYGPFAGANA
ncbi:5-formyltetrahydrofolate cyclo-ligase [Novosphingobium sp.]|uniref:5-formyltetrahydrofolate cyclo-ligase n=1 Tax=Novosphingobium sp. TaxID=1874826 RepID=UPI0025FEA487|nr:5-formyltetrahydrofolate cyclo-ligase [Novosphingobium sp.]